MKILKNKYVQGLIAAIAVYLGFPLIGLGAYKVIGVLVIAGLVYIKVENKTEE